MADNKIKYVDEEALKHFLIKVKDAYSNNSADSFKVGWAEKAHSDEEGHPISGTYVPFTRTIAGIDLQDDITSDELNFALETVRGVYVTWSDGTETQLDKDSDFKVHLDISAYALKSEFVPKTTKINGKVLTGDITIKGEDIPIGEYEIVSDVKPNDMVSIAVHKVDNRLVALDEIAVKEVDMGEYGHIEKDGNTITISMDIASNDDIDSLF